MSSLRRASAAGFDGEDAWPLEHVVAAEHPEELLLPVDTLFQDREGLTVSVAVEKKIRNGMTAVMPSLAPGEYRVYAQNGGFLALCQAKDGKLTTIKSFFEV